MVFRCHGIWIRRLKQFNQNRGDFVSTIEVIIAIVCAVIASTGFWTFIQSLKTKKSASTRMLMGLAHDRIMFLSGHYIKRGYITQEEYEDLIKYLYEPYLELGGNGSAKHVIENGVNKLPVCSYEEWKRRQEEKK